MTTPIRRDTAMGRFYDVGGEAFPSVTHILSVIGKPALLNWAAAQEREAVTEAAADLYLDLARTAAMAPPLSRPVYLTTLAARLGTVKAHRRTLEKAGAIGTQVHAAIEWTLRHQLGQDVGAEPVIDEPARRVLRAYHAWAASVALVPRLIEQTVYSRIHRYAGTMDLLADINGISTLVDFKTGKAIYGEAHLQNVAYQTALIEMGHAEPAGGLIVRLPKVAGDLDFEIAPVTPVAEAFPVFLAVRRLWAWQQAQDAAYQARRAPVVTIGQAGTRPAQGAL